ncbi:MAG: hypothetical protein HY719_13980, partial [Planctomycetes bacterium]|nr:hypothetical protein [Planctomycetota bacterium]
MTLAISQSVVSNSALRALATSNARMRDDFTRIAGGLRINRASDDVSGLVGSETLRAQVAGLRVVNEGIQRGINLLHTAEAGLSQVSNLLIGLRSLLVDSENVKDPASQRFLSLDQNARDILASVDRFSKTQRFASLGFFNSPAPRTLSFLDDPTPTGGPDLTVDGFSTIGTGNHTITTVQRAIVKSLDYAGMLGEGGLILDPGGAGATALPTILSGGAGTVTDDDTAVGNILYYDGAAFRAIDARDTQNPDADADGANETGAVNTTPGTISSDLGVANTGAVVYRNGNDVYALELGESEGAATNVTDSVTGGAVQPLTADNPSLEQIGTAGRPVAFDLNSAAGASNLAPGIGNLAGLAINSATNRLYAVSQVAGGTATVVSFADTDGAISGQVTEFNLSGFGAEDQIVGMTFNASTSQLILMVESDSASNGVTDPTNVDNVDRFLKLTPTGGTQAVNVSTGLVAGTTKVAAGAFLASIQENTAAGAVTDHASLRDTAGVGNPSGADFSITSSANITQAMEGDTYNVVFTRAQGGAVANDNVTVSLTNENAPPAAGAVTFPGTPFNSTGETLTLDLGAGNAIQVVLSNVTTTEVSESGVIADAANQAAGIVLAANEKAQFTVNFTNDNGVTTNRTVNLVGAGGGSNLADLATQVTAALGGDGTAAVVGGTKLSITSTRQNDFVAISYSAGTSSNLTYGGAGSLIGSTIRKVTFNLTVSDDLDRGAPGVPDSGSITLDYTGAGSNSGLALAAVGNIDTFVADINTAIAANATLAGRVTAARNGNTIDFALVNNTSSGSDLDLSFTDGDDNTSVTLDTAAALGANAFLGVGNQTRDFTLTVGSSSATINLNTETVGTTAQIVTAIQNQLNASAFGAGAFTVSDLGGGQLRIQANAGVATIDSALQNGGGVVIAETAGNERTNLAYDNTTDLAVNGLRKVGFNADVNVGGVVTSASWTSDFTGAGSNGNQTTIATIVTQINTDIGGTALSGILQAVADGNTVNFQVVNSADDAKLLSATFNAVTNTNDITLDSTSALGAAAFLGVGAGARTFDLALGNQSISVDLNGETTGTTAQIVTAIQNQLNASAFGAGAFTVSDAGGGTVRIVADGTNANVNTALAQGGGLVITESAGNQRTNLVYDNTTDVTTNGIRKADYDITVNVGGVLTNATFTADFTGAGSNGVETNVANIVTELNTRIGATALNGLIQAVADGNTVNFEVVNSADDAKLLSATFNAVSNTNNVTLTSTSALGATGFLGVGAGARTFDLALGNQSISVDLDGETTGTTAQIVTALQNQLNASAFGAGAFTVSDAGGGTVRIVADGTNANVNTALAQGGGLVITESAGDQRTDLTTTSG